ncbi:MAG: TetR/AcrR family transcriptional regulator [Polyangiaceae bacterium]
MSIHTMNADSHPEAPLTRREEQKAIIRNAILDAAEAVFAEKGFHGARIQDVAREARIAVGTVYNHFEQKDDLLRAVLEDRSAQLLERLSPRPSDPEPFEARLTARFARVLAFIDEHRAFFQVASQHGVFGLGASRLPSADTSAACGKRMQQVERIRAMFRGMIEEGLAAGVLQPTEPQALVWCLGGIFKTFTLGALEHNAPSLEGLAPTITHLFLHGAGRVAPPKTDSPRTPEKTARRVRRPAR